MFYWNNLLYRFILGIKIKLFIFLGMVGNDFFKIYIYYYVEMIVEI